MRYNKTYAGNITKRRKQLNNWKVKVSLASFIWVVLLVVVGVYSSGHLRKDLMSYETYDRPVAQNILDRARLDVKSSPDVREIRKAVYELGYGELAVSDLYAIGKVESENNKDRKCSINTNGTTDCGYFRINSIHQVAESCKIDVYCSAKWVIKRLIENGYNDNRLYALGTHNSKTPDIHAKYLSKLTKYLTVK